MDVMKIMKVYGRVSDVIGAEMVGYDVTEVKSTRILIEMQDKHTFEIDLTEIIDEVFGISDKSEESEESDDG